MAISPTRQELITSLVTYINLATGISVDDIIRGKQNAPSPLGNYATLLYVTDSTYGIDEIVTSENLVDNTQLDYEIRGTRRYSFNVQFFRNRATDFAKEFMQFHRTPAGITFLQQAPYTFRVINQITESAEVVSQNYEERAILVLELWVRERQTVLVNTVCGIDIDLPGIVTGKLPRFQ